MAWRELQLDKAIWVLPYGRVKNRKGHIVPLSRQAVELGRGIEHGCDYVLHTNFTTPISGYSKAKAELDRLIGGGVLSRGPYTT
jgi:integrase